MGRYTYSSREYRQHKYDDRKATYTCPTCKRPGTLTASEHARGYQCSACTRRDEAEW